MGRGVVNLPIIDPPVTRATFVDDLLDLEHLASGVYLFSNSRACDDEQAADLARLRNWARCMGLTLYGDPDDPPTPPLPASGHATGPELVEFVQTVRPRTLIPIHTEQPEWWPAPLAGTGIAVRRPQLGQPFPIP